MSSKLRNFEIKSYFIFWTSAVLFSLHSFFEISNKYFENYDDYYDDFTPGLHFLSRKKDISDFEWQAIRYMCYAVYPWSLLFLIISEAFQKLNFKFIMEEYFCICFTTFFIVYKFGLNTLGIIVLQPIIFTVASAADHTGAIWICNGVSLIAITLFKQHITSIINLTDFDNYLVILSMCWTNLRCTSYYLDSKRHDIKTNKRTKIAFINFVSYCFYLPLFFSGPFISYEDFIKYQKLRSYKSWPERLNILLLNIVRCMCWMMTIEFILHFVYVSSTSFHPELVLGFDSWSLYGYGYAMGQFFHMKYLVLYGLSTALARFDNIPTPHLPRCIGRVHLYSDMWKYFDPGLYKFLTRYIYIPVLKSIQNMQLEFISFNIALSKMISSFICFVFVYVWHGVEHYILIWTLLNFAGVVFENVGRSICKNYAEKWLLPYIHEDGMRRLTCMMASPLLAVSAISNFYFFAGIEIGNIFFYRLIYDKTVSTIILLMILYCCCQVSTELRSKNAKQM